MKRNEQIALVCDYLRSKDDIAGYINDEVGINHVGVPKSVVKVVENEFLDTMEAMNFSYLGEWLVFQLVDAYLQKAIAWRDEKRAA